MSTVYDGDGVLVRRPYDFGNVAGRDMLPDIETLIPLTERPQDVLVGSFICGHRTEVVDALRIIRKITQRCAVRR